MSSANYYAGAAVTYYTASGQPAFNTVVTVGAPVWEKMLPVPNNKVVFRQRFMQTAASYTPLTYDTTYPSDATYGVPTATTYYLVSEENFNNERGGLLTWDRVYSCVPTSWVEPEEYAYNYPAFNGSQTVGTTYNVTAIAASGTYYSISSSMTFSVGDTLFVNVAFTRSGIGWRVSSYAQALGGSSGTNVLVSAIFGGSGAFTGVSGSIGKGTPARGTPTAYVVPSSIVNDYAFSSVTALDANLPLINAFVVIDNTGYETNTIYSNTIPSTSTYVSMVANGTQIVAATSSRKRFLGNIYVRSTRYVPAK